MMDKSMLNRSGFGPIQGRSFFSALFDMSFTSFVTPRIGKLLYILAMVAITIEYVLFVVFFTIWLGSGLLVPFMLAGLVVAFVTLVYARMTIESVMAFFAAAGHLKTIAGHATTEPDAETGA